ncbi:MAG: transcription elongation factor GreA [Bacteroidetes bacterium GWF2_43_63]|nr:MAG: transcription elongation factor GreA [Bacteroidetes bacterium GWE2_42_42]OFY55562.1 MAG: transcription elongation factor GreA [Bacteroidetes bacterium GWF2_43_63]HBG71574.1 transcription elongation factor GreA [Bacteroidales bacterium]HCB62107.1 transcription elongation factor GreA [Bacteroidales bacterium]HCY22335.1 transcription elongation factor GreA [Bacteroidales bacterium]
MAKQTYITKEGLEKLKADLNQLMSVERPKISKQIAEARDKGDLSENAEYDAAKDAQGMLELKISHLQEIVSNSRIIDESKLDNSKVRILSTVTLENKKTKQKMTYTLVPDQEADLKAGKLSVNSPIAQALLGKKVGESADVTVPAGIISIKLLEIN